MGGWSQVPDDLLCKIVESSSTVADCIRFQAVCTSWRSAMKDKSSLPLPCQQFPWLMLPYREELGSKNGVWPRNNNQNGGRAFFSVSENKVYHIDLQEATIGSRCCGSSHGWLVMVDYTSSSIFLLNPFTKQRIELPPLTAFPDILDFRPDRVGKEYIYRCLSGTVMERSLNKMERFYVQKVILSTDPTASDCIVMAICGDVLHLAFCKPGDETWTLIPQPENHGYDDIVFWRNQFYAVDSRGSVAVCDIGVSPPNETLFIQGPSTWIGGITRYLIVDPSGELLLVVRHHFPDPDDDNEENDDEDGDDNFNDDDDEDSDSDSDSDSESDYEGDDRDDEDEDNDSDYEDHDLDNNDLDDYEVSNATPYKTSHFDIYELDKESKNWTKVNSLGNYMLFLGSNRGVCLLAREGFSQCKRNCIYFVDDYFCGYEEGRMGGHDLGVFNLEDKSIKPFPCCPDDTLLIWPPPIWVTPSLSLSQSI